MVGKPLFLSFFIILIISFISNSGSPGFINHAFAVDCSTIIPNTDLTGCDLSNSNLSHMDLHGINFSHAILANANLTGANLQGTTLDYTDFTGAILDNADFSGGNLFLTNFAGDTMTGTNFSGAYMKQVIFDSALTTNVNFTNANLDTATFAAGTLTDDIFTNSNLNHADFSSATVITTTFTGATFIQTNFVGTNLSGIDLSNNNFAGDLFSSGIFQNTNFSNSILTGAFFDGADLTNANFSGANLTGVTFDSNTILLGINLTGANLACTGAPFCASGPPPTLSSVSDISVSQDNPLGTSVLYTLPTATSSVGLGSNNVICTPAPGFIFPPGSTTVNCSVQDILGQTATTSFLVTVVDTTPPTINVNGVNPATVQFNAVYTDAGATATDNSGSATLTTTGTVNTHALGTYTIIYTATDPSGNTATATRTVNVVNTIPPTINVNGANPVTITVGSTYTDAGATATDVVDGVLTSNIQTSGTVDVNTVGTYTITYKITDSVGLTTTATRTVNVVAIVTNTPGHITGGGTEAADAHFAFEVKSKDGIAIKGHLEYHDKISNIDLDSIKVTQFSVDPSGTLATFGGQAMYNKQDGYTFQVNIEEHDKQKDEQEHFTITIFDPNGNNLYFKSGKLIHGDIEIHKVNKNGDDEQKDHDKDSKDKSK